MTKLRREAGSVVTVGHGLVQKSQKPVRKYRGDCRTREAYEGGRYGEHRLKEEDRRTGTNKQGTEDINNNRKSGGRCTLGSTVATRCRCRRTT